MEGARDEAISSRLCRTSIIRPTESSTQRHKQGENRQNHVDFCATVKTRVASAVTFEGILVIEVCLLDVQIPDTVCRIPLELCTSAS